MRDNDPGPPDRPRMPKGYGLSDSGVEFAPLSWAWLGEKMASSRNYWVASTGSDEQPHVIPVWGVWIDDTFYFFTDRHSKKARNLELNSRAVVHLESGDDVVILEGRLEAVTFRATIETVGAEYENKYDLNVTVDSNGPVLYRLVHHKALAWVEKDFPRCATRWLF